MNVGVLCLTNYDSGGVHQYTLSLLEALKLIDNQTFTFIQIRHSEFPKILNIDIVSDEFRNLNIVNKLLVAMGGITGYSFKGLLLKSTIKKLKNIDFIISPIISLLPLYLGKRYIVTMHDFQQKYYPDFFTLKERIKRNIVYRTGKFSDGIIVESNYVKQDVLKFLGVSESKVFVIPSPPPSYLRDSKIEYSNLINVSKKYEIDYRFIFYPAQFWYHKNHINLLKSLLIIKHNYGLEIPLVLVGSKKNNFDNVMRFIKENNLDNQVKYLGYVPNDEMLYLYKLSTALVMPSLFESVSLPIWEAFYLGVPVASSNACGLPEQVGDAGLIFDPNNPKDIAEKIYRIWTDSNLRQELVERGYNRIKEFTIESYAKQWNNILKTLLIDKRWS